MFITACSCKLVLPACWPHAGMQLRAACVVFLPCLRFLGMFSACWWHIKTCFICHVYSRPRLALACFMTACSCKLVLRACWPHAGMQLRAACVVFLPCLRFLGMFSACCWHVKTCFICHVYSRPRLALACFMTACSCKLVLPACWPHAGMQLRAACVVFLPCLRFLGMFSACWWHVKTCFICHVYSRPRPALACLWRLARASLSYRHVGLTQVCSYVLPASSSCHVCGFSACLVRVPNYIVLSP